MEYTVTTHVRVSFAVLCSFLNLFVQRGATTSSTSTTSNFTVSSASNSNPSGTLPVWLVLVIVLVGTNVLLIIFAFYTMYRKRRATLSQIEHALKTMPRPSSVDSFSDDPDEVDSWTDDDETSTVPSRLFSSDESETAKTESDASGWN